MIGIVDYGCGNIKSLKNALFELDIKNDLIKSKDSFSKYEKIIIPGVGSYFNALNKIREIGFENEIKKFIGADKKILGICIGMQILSELGSEGGKTKGLNLIEGNVELISNKKNVSHVGWNNIQKEKDSLLFKNIKDNTDFYFVHSYYFNVTNKNEISTSVNFLNKQITASVEKKNIFGVQFHPEKSLDNGLKILKNFSEI
ncbi:imidazole glycerol phosphate synthase subunit HisH [Candidatus Pelagibacter sp.]|nr:imidazole glycerol phosphate synthase subunit HisH [Candidatus Pelagibacter sp.]